MKRKIESMSVLKDEWAVERYGEAAADGVVYVTTTEGARQFGRLECSFEHGNSFQEGPGFYRIKDTGNGFAIRPLNGARPLVSINGRQVDDDYLKSIDAGKVLWVRILQPGFELLDRYGERAWDGVIEFGTNESGERTTLAVYSSDASGKRNKMTVVRELPAPPRGTLPCLSLLLRRRSFGGSYGGDLYGWSGFGFD